MRMETARQAATEAAELLNEGSLEDNGALRVAGSSTVCAFVTTMIILTEPTRLVVRRQKDRLDCVLKWQIVPLLEHLSVKWWRAGEDEPRGMRDVATALTRAGLISYGRLKLSPGSTNAARESVDRLREAPTPLLENLHHSLGVSLRQSESLPPLRLPTVESKGGVPEDLVQRCLLLPYEDRKVLVKDWERATCEGGDEIQALLREVRVLRPLQAMDLRKMLY